jgi:hypothetical protein
MNKRDRVDEFLEDGLYLDPPVFDRAIIGICHRFGMEPVVAYDRKKVIDILARDMSREDAEEYFEFNTIGAWVGEQTPVFIEVIK